MLRNLREGADEAIDRKGPRRRSLRARVEPDAWVDAVAGQARVVVALDAVAEDRNLGLVLFAFGSFLS